MVAIPFAGFVFKAQPILWKALTNPILWEFALGVLACILWERRWLAPLRTAFAAVFALFLIAGALVVWLSPDTILALNKNPVEAAHTAVRSLYWGLPAFLFFCLAIGSAGLVDGPLARLLKLLGDASYSIYLSHLFVVMLLRAVVERMSLQPDLIVITTLVLSAVVGVFVYRLAEEPMLAVGRQSIRRWAARHVQAVG